MRYEGPPWAAIAAKRKLEETEHEFKEWRTRFVRVSERILQELEKGQVSEGTKKKLRQFIEETKDKGIYKK